MSRNKTNIKMQLNKRLDALLRIGVKKTNENRDTRNGFREEQKMIACQLIQRVEIRKGYEIKVFFNSTYEQFFCGADEAEEIQCE